jgi:G3E family GTPase
LKRTSKIPVTVITGFLGAGKTTFINSLLSKYSDIQFALVENEFGDVAIDTKLIKGLDASQMFELKQGCICCTISDEFELVLQELAERFPNVEHLLIETTGVADPASVIQPFFRDENLKKTYQYNGSVCLLDALNFEDQPEPEIFIKQFVTADLVVVNKSDLISDDQKRSLQNKIQNINPFAEIQSVKYGNAESIQLNAIQPISKTEFDFVRLSNSHSHIQTKTLLFSKPLDMEEFMRWLEYTLDIHKSQIYRTKGILCFENEPYEFILQGVGGSFELIEGDLILGATKSELVFIGKLDGLDLEF